MGPLDKTAAIFLMIISNVLFKHTRRPYSNHISRFYMYDIYRITCFFTNMTVCVTEQITWHVYKRTYNVSQISLLPHLLKRILMRCHMHIKLFTKHFDFCFCPVYYSLIFNGKFSSPSNCFFVPGTDVETRGPSEYKDRLSRLWGFPC